MYSVKNNETFCHRLVLIRGKVECPLIQPSYPNDIDPYNGRFITVKKTDGSSKNWPINSYHEFKVLISLAKGNNKITFYYNYKSKSKLIERASTEIDLFYFENINMEPVRLGIFIAKDSKGFFDMDRDSLSRGEKNDYDSAIKRVRMAALLWQAFTSDSLNSYDLGRKSFRFLLDPSGGSYYV